MADDPDTDADADPGDDRSDLDHAATAIDRGEMVAYPTETVYGLGADALDAEAVSRVFALKGRSSEKPISMGLGSIEAVDEYTSPTTREEQFLEAFLPGPVTVLLERHGTIPDILTAERDRVGVRVPDHDLARALARRCGPVTATSANRSGGPNARRVDDLDPEIHEGVTAVLDGGPTRGVESTVVDVDGNEILRRGAGADAIEEWLAEH